MKTVSDLPESKPTVDALITAEESAHEAEYGKYKQYKLGELDDSIEVHEYVGPLGVGYICIEYAIKGNTEYARAWGEGAENWRYFDWRELQKI